MARSEDEATIAALHKAKDALKQIKSALVPFLEVLKNDSRIASSESNETKGIAQSKKRSKPDSIESPKLDAHKQAEAEAAVACKYLTLCEVLGDTENNNYILLYDLCCVCTVAIGTLRYMGARLRGLDQGRKKGDPLRVELDNIRAKLVELKNLEASMASDKDAKSDNSTSEKKEGTQQNDDTMSKKRRKVLDTDASQRMIKSALNNK